MPAENEQLNDFLATGTPPEAPAGTPGTPAPSPAATPPPAESKPATPAPTPGTPATKEPEHEDDDIAALAGSDNRTVPFSAFEKVRNDWKSKAAAADARAEELRRQLDDLKRMQAAPPPAAVEPPPPPPDVAKDPQAWAANFTREQQRMLLNERLNMSEAMVAERIGREDLDKYVAEFKQAATKDPLLFKQLYNQASPYAWMVQEMDRQRQRAEIGDDPVAYKARLRAEWEAEQQAGNGPRASPAAGLPPSLANTRSVAGRTQSTFTGPLPLEEILRKPAPANNRR
jgi:hypothetical protein